MPAPDWEDVDAVRNADGVEVTISKKKGGGSRYAVALFKVFTVSATSEEKKTIWIDPEKIDSAIEVLKEARKRIGDLALKELAETSGAIKPGQPIVRPGSRKR